MSRQVYAEARPTKRCGEVRSSDERGSGEPAMSRRAQVGQVASFTTGLYRERYNRWYAGRVRGDELARLRLRQGRRDPYPIYERIRVKGPMQLNRFGNWATTSHALCSQVLRSRSFGVAEQDQPPSNGGQMAFDLSFLALNPPAHDRLRRLAGPAFSPKMMATYATKIQKTVHGLLDAAEQRDAFDLVADFAAPLPIAVITEMMGVPDADVAAFQRYGTALGSALDGLTSLAHVREVIRANAELEGIFESLFALRAREPRDDLISALVAARGEQIQPSELVPMCTLLLIAGFETTVNLIGNGTLALLHNPEQWDLLRSQPSLAGQAVEEMLRYDPPVQDTARVSFEDTELAGVPVRRNQWVITLLAAANRDPEVFADPGRFDITRSAGADHLSFSSGIHYCLGASLARLEATIAFTALATRMPLLRQAGRVVMRPSSTIRGPRRLPVAPR